MTRETTPEQQSRDLLEQMGMLLDCGDGKTRDPQSMSSGELVFLANLIADKRRAEAERDALRKDAERYRWLRGDAPASSERWTRWNLQRWDGRCWHSLERVALDAAIDAALAREEVV